MKLLKNTKRDLKKTKLILLLIPAILFSCLTVKEKVDKKEVQLELINFNYWVDVEKSLIGNDGLYTVYYKFKVIFQNSISDFQVNIKIFDINSNILYEKENLIPEHNINIENEFFIEGMFSSAYTLSSLNYEIEVNFLNKKSEYTKIINNNQIPVLNDYTIGPIITKHDKTDNINVSLAVNLEIINCNNIKWIRFIPPSMDSFWDLPWSKEDLSYTVNSVIFDKNKISLENGTYYLQINLGKYGTIQKEIKIVDFFNNKSGSNYGLSVPSYIKQDKNYIKLDINLLEKIDYMELWVYLEMEGELKKLGIAKYNSPIEIISKKSIKENVYDDFENHVKLKYNKEYKCRVYLYSKEFNNIKYISISDFFSFKISGFLFFSF